MKKILPAGCTPSLPIFYVALMLAVSTAETVQAQQDYLGANAVLQQVVESTAKPGEKPKKDEQTILRDDLTAFGQSVTNLAPADAAKRWLELVDRAAKIQRQSSRNYNPSTVPLDTDDLLGVLPPPVAWAELAKAIAARPAKLGDEELSEAGLRFLAASLTGDTDGRNREITNLQAKAESADAQSAYLYQSILQQLSQSMLAMSDDPDVILKSLERQLNTAGSRGIQSLAIPNLVPQVGAEKAEAFLRKALVTPNAVLQFSQANETSRLAQKLALELMDQLKTPQWGLVNSLDAVELYEALDKHFDTQTNDATPIPGMPPDINIPNMDPEGGIQKSQAQVYYLLGLISKNRTQDAIAVAKKINGRDNEYLFDEAFKAMEQAGYTDAMDNFFHELLSQDPSLPFWNEYEQLAAGAGQTERMVALARTAAAREDLSDNKKTALREILFKALLAADNVDEGVQEMRKLISSSNDDTASYDEQNTGELGIDLAKIGVLTQKPEWTEEGIGVAKKWLVSPEGQNPNQWSGNSVETALAEILFDLKRGPEAEAVLTDALVNHVRTDKSRSSEEYYNNNNLGASILTELATLYYKSGRYADVVTLLEQAPYWGARDISELSAQNGSEENPVGIMWLHAPSASLPLLSMAASSLAATGRNEEARKITDALLDSSPDSDRGYELLVALDGTNAIPKLDELFARDQFEKRPLIWKAHLLRQQGNLEEAEKIIRQAISIDPSDGQSGPGDRMRAYAELADIREARGDQKEADFNREIVKAIRLSENADQFYTVGLLKRAIAMYQEGLSHFSDAYCIQSRMAIQLAAMGDNQAAEEHYRRAYELMPDSFGRVESHCFGCEKAFDGEQAQSIADKVFTQLVAERPDKPQVHYLLGYLRGEEERYNEAQTNYLEAVRLDPDYLNAWVKIQEVGEQTLMSSKQRDDIAFNILRLDPLQRHAQPAFDRVTDLTGLWNAKATAASHQPAPATNLLALAASKIALDKRADNSGDQSVRMETMERMQEDHKNLSPARAVAQTPFVRLAAQMILGGISGFDD
jgi:tetratricopeptide (TPR) repeat protein